MRERGKRVERGASLLQRYDIASAERQQFASCSEGPGPRALGGRVVWHCSLTGHSHVPNLGAIDAKTTYLTPSLLRHLPAWPVIHRKLKVHFIAQI